jgi:hypothetical protein
MQVAGHDLADGRLSMSGWTSGVAQDSEDTLNSKPNPTPNRSPNRPALGCLGQWACRAVGNPRASGSDAGERVGSGISVQVGEGPAGGF